MADQDFETRLHRLFADAPPFADGPVFAARLQARLDRGWAWRRALITSAGLVGGAVAALQFGGGRLVRHLDAISEQSLGQLRGAASHALAVLPAEIPGLRGLPFGSEPMWLVGALALLGVGFLAARLLEEI